MPRNAHGARCWRGYAPRAWDARWCPRWKSSTADRHPPGQACCPSTPHHPAAERRPGPRPPSPAKGSPLRPPAHAPPLRNRSPENAWARRCSAPATLQANAALPLPCSACSPARSRCQDARRQTAVAATRGYWAATAPPRRRASSPARRVRVQRRPTRCATGHEKRSGRSRYTPACRRDRRAVVRANAEPGQQTSWKIC